MSEETTLAGVTVSERVRKAIGYVAMAIILGMMALSVGWWFIQVIFAWPISDPQVVELMRVATGVMIFGIGFLWLGRLAAWGLGGDDDG